MAPSNYDTMDALDWTKIIAIGLVWTPSAYFFNSWVNSQPPSTSVSIACVIFSIVSLLASFHLVLFAIFVLLSPLFALGLLYRLLLALPYLCAGFGPWFLSLFCAHRPLRYASRLERSPGKDCRLCGKCRNIVDQSSILRGTRWRLTRSKEEYDFYTKDQLQQSSKECHLCSLLWHSSFDAQTTLVPGTCSEDAMVREPDITTPLLSAVPRSCNSRDCEQGVEARNLSIQISATREFGSWQSLQIRLYNKGSSPFPWLQIEDASYASSKHHCGQSNITGSEASFQWARDIVEKCEREHHNCRNHFIRPTSQRYLPKRLIDVQAREKGVIQLVLSRTLKLDSVVEYAALSHCWGTTVKSELRKDNEETMKTILIETLDPNFRDAVDITYKMGIKYLWIDSLCIMQRTQEWEEESGDMGLVYARAKVVISATASKNSEGGCYKPKDLFPYDCVLCSNWTSSLVVRSTVKYADLVQLFGEKVDCSFLATRGWTFQERFLASRILHFCSGLMMFECNTLTTSECHREEEYPRNTQFSQNGTLNAPTVPNPGREPPKQLCRRTIVRRAGISTRPVTRPAKNTVKKRWYANPEHKLWANKKRRYDAQMSSIRTNAARLSIRGAFSFLWSFRGQDMKEKAEFHLRWYEMVTSYSVRNLTNDNDKMMAIAGVAYFIQQSTGFKYAAGLWEDTLAFNLLWVVDSGVKRRPSGRSVPSWSWASVDGKISHRLKRVDPSSKSGSRASSTVGVSSVPNSWEYIESLVSDLEIQGTHVVNGMAHNATLKLSCQLRSFGPSSLKYVYDTLENHERGEIRCLPVLEFVNHRVGLMTRTPQIHGILVRAASGTSNQAEGTLAQYMRVGHFCTEKTNIHFEDMTREGQLPIELI
ncbi:related to tol protein [Fusarium proliferatum]|nr:related to tol protein [Fusarium proliferatum]